MRKFRVVALLLPLLVLRALIPAGFMVSMVGGAAELTFCGASQHDPAHHGTTRADPSCPFAQSSGPAPLPALPALAQSLDSARFELPAAVAQTAAPFGPVRQHVPRGPPALI
jgi:hypothetical protein